MDQQLEHALQKVRKDNMEWNKFKGEFFAISEPIMNKDVLAFKLDRV